MKIRTGFVSNSSSSSFIIAYKKGDVCPHCGRSDVDLRAMIEQRQNNDYAEETRFDTDDVNEILSSIDDYYDVDEKIQTKDDVRKYEKAGYTIMKCEIGYHDNVLLDSLESMKNAGTVIVIRQLD